MDKFIKSSKERLDAINEYLESILNNRDVHQIYLKHQNHFEAITPFDVFNILYWNEEYHLEDDQIKILAGKLMNTFRSGLKNFQWNHSITLINTLLDEGLIIKTKFSEIKGILKSENLSNKQQLLKEKIKALIDLEKRHQAFEYIIFSILENRIPNSRPLSVMWSLYDDAISLRKRILVLLNDQLDQKFNEAIGKYFFLILGIIEKEELLILPIASIMIEKDEWEQLEKEAATLGYSFQNNQNNELHQMIEEPTNDFLFKGNNGGLSLEELILIFDKLGLDITFVDEDNKVKFYNNPQDRLFVRTPSIIGRDVNKCHPPKSVHIVEEIIRHFKANLKDEAKFWINYQDRFIVITYYAIRNHQGVYKGVLEVSQDCTEIKKLEGEQRLLQWKK